MYNEPQWATKPSNDYNWSLLEIKNGVECGIHRLTDPTTVLGRASDIVNITLAHESCSRQHARIAFDSQGYPWLRDLSSTHGTTCNKRELPSEAIGKVESNSTKTGARGIMLFPGDVLQFGASSRLFCIQGPIEYERGTYKAKIQQQKQSLGSSHNSLSTIQQQQQQQDKNTPSTSTSQNESGISWGMSMDDISEDDQQQQFSTDKTLPMELDVPEKHRKAFERLNAMKYKLSNMETEDMRIRRKGELSEGQERQLQRNQEREEQLKSSIVDLEEELYDKLYPEKAAAANKNKKRRANHKYDADGDDDDDDFFDRTKQTEKDEIDDDGESQETLIVKWKAMYKQEQYRIETTIPKAREDVSLLHDRLRKLEERGDDESAFFTKNDLDLANESLSKIHKQQSKCHETMDRIEHLLKIVNSKIVADRTTGYIGEGPPPPPASAPPVKTTDNDEGGDSSRKRSNYVHSPERQPEIMPPPPPHSTTTGSPSNNEQKSMPPPTMGSRGGAAVAIEQHRSMPPPPISASMSRSSMAPPPIMPPPLMVKQDSNNYKSVVVGGGTGDPTIMPPPIMPPPTKRKRIVGPSMPPPPASFSSSPPPPPPPPSSSISSQPPSPKKQMTPKSAASGGSGSGSTLASIASMFQGDNESSSSSKANNNNGKSRKEDSNTKGSKNAIGLKEDVWQAPKDQDGSGITKLNAKFAGRY